MAEPIKELDLSVLENISIPEIQSDGRKVEVEEEFIENSITEVESIEDLEKDVDNTETEETEDFVETVESTSTENTETTEEDPILSVAQWGHEIGIFDLDEEEYKKAEDKEDYFRNKFLDKAKAFGLESLPPVIKELAEKYYEGVPLDELITVQSNLQRLEGITDEVLTEDESIQENLVKHLLTLQEYDPEEIDKKIAKLKDALLLEDEAKTALKKLKIYEQKQANELVENAKKEEAANQKKYQEYLDDLKNTFKEKSTFIPNVEISKESKEKMLTAITRRDRDGLTELERKMKDKNVQLAVAQFVLLHDAKIDSIKRTATTEAATKAKETANSNSTEKTKSGKLDLGVARKAMTAIKRRSL